MQSEIDEKGYVVLRNFIDPDIIQLLKTYFYDIKLFRLKNDPEFSKQHLTTGTDVAPSQHTFYGDFLIETISLLYGEKLCNLLGKDLSPTYTFTRIYEKGQPLHAHRDRFACEYSLTIPIFISDHRASSIYISHTKADFDSPGRLSYEEAEKIDTFSKVDLLPGDALAYKGVEKYHWRYPLESDMLIQFFMHYVETNGIYKEEVFDRRPFMGFPASKAKNI